VRVVFFQSPECFRLILVEMCYVKFLQIKFIAYFLIFVYQLVFNLIMLKILWKLVSMT